MLRSPREELEAMYALCAQAARLQASPCFHATPDALQRLLGDVLAPYGEHGQMVLRGEVRLRQLEASIRSSVAE